MSSRPIAEDGPLARGNKMHRLYLQNSPYLQNSAVRKPFLVCIGLPPELKQQIQDVAAAEHQSFREWVITRLSESVEDERSCASLARAAERRERLKEVVKQIRASGASAE